MPFDFEQMKPLQRRPEPEELRQDLLEEVLHGDVSPEDAERKAIEWGLGGFSGCPNPNAFPVMEQDVWSFDMALAWIIWRATERVVEYWPRYRAACLGWEPIHQLTPKAEGGRSLSVSGYRLVQFPQRSILSGNPMHGMLICNQQNAPRTDEKLDRTAAEKAFRRALIDSQLVASATDCETIKIVDIPAREWSRIHYSTSEGTELFIPPSDFFEPEDVEPLYRDVTVLRKDVLRLWPQSGPDFLAPRVEPQPSAFVSEKEYRTWLATLPKTHQVVGRFFWEVWNLDLKPIDDESRRRLVEKYAKDVLGGAPPSARTIARFFDDVQPWLKANGL